MIDYWLKTLSSITCFIDQKLKTHQIWQPCHTGLIPQGTRLVIKASLIFWYQIQKLCSEIPLPWFLLTFSQNSHGDAFLKGTMNEFLKVKLSSPLQRYFESRSSFNIIKVQLWCFPGTNLKTFCLTLFFTLCNSI